MKENSYHSFQELEAAQPPVCAQAEALFAESCAQDAGKWIVLDDDPTGVQTVNGISVYTDWTEESITEGFQEDRPLFFILTNSRGMTREETIRVHREIAERVLAVSQRLGIPFRLISRSDSTLRGHYPTETEVLKDTLESRSDLHFDGEVICPFFPQGGRYTIDNIHYVRMGDQMVPAAETEFAGDKTFGYQHSELGAWVEEKTGGRYRAEDQIFLSLRELRSGNIRAITEQLLRAENFTKIVVNAMAYEDIYVFAAALMQAIRAGKQYMFRTAAVLPEVLGRVRKRPLLEGAEMVDAGNPNGGLIVVGSHVKKTTDQLRELLKEDHLHAVEFRSSLVLDQEAFQAEQERVQQEMESALKAGENVVVYTERKLLLPDSGDPEDALRLSLKIADAVTGFVAQLSVRPRFLIAKGGITSSEVGVRGLKVRRAEVAGQILAGIPVWRTGEGSRFPGLSYIIFPGNVGDEFALRQAYRKLTSV